MIGPTAQFASLVTTKPVDFRKGAEGVAALVRETMQADPFDGAIYMFRAKRTDRIKLVFWDGTGVCYLPNGWRTGVPQAEDRIQLMQLSAAQFSALHVGLDWKRVHERDAGTDAAGLICGIVNYGPDVRRDTPQNMICFAYAADDRSASR